MRHHDWEPPSLEAYAHEFESLVSHMRWAQSRQLSSLNLAELTCFLGYLQHCKWLLPALQSGVCEHNNNGDAILLSHPTAAQQLERYAGNMARKRDPWQTYVGELQWSSVSTTTITLVPPAPHWVLFKEHNWVQSSVNTGGWACECYYLICDCHQASQPSVYVWVCVYVCVCVWWTFLTKNTPTSSSKAIKDRERFHLNIGSL